MRGAALGVKTSLRIRTRTNVSPTQSSGARINPRGVKETISIEGNGGGKTISSRDSNADTTSRKEVLSSAFSVDRDFLGFINDIFVTRSEDGTYVGVGDG